LTASPGRFRSPVTHGVAPRGRGGRERWFNLLGYNAHPIEQMSHPLTMLAFDMNDESLTFGHGAPLRLRNEGLLGFKQVT
jgi:DMSO/TMAO reductase YedYZ molybdopterin-dependent catalytic subunit